MANGTQKTIEAGVAVVVGLMLAIVGAGILQSAAYDTTFSVDTQSEWQAYENSAETAGVEYSDGSLSLLDSATQGKYQSVQLDSNESDATRLYLSVNYPDETDSGIVGLKFGETLYTNSEYFNATSGRYEEGTYRVDVTDIPSVQSFQLLVGRDNTSVQSPEVQFIKGQLQSGGLGLLGVVGPAAFALLLLLVIAQIFDVNSLNISRKP